MAPQSAKSKSGDVETPEGVYATLSFPTGVTVLSHRVETPFPVASGLCLPSAEGKDTQEEVEPMSNLQPDKQPLLANPASG